MWTNQSESYCLDSVCPLSTLSFHHNLKFVTVSLLLNSSWEFQILRKEITIKNHNFFEVFYSVLNLNKY